MKTLFSPAAACAALLVVLAVPGCRRQGLTGEIAPAAPSPIPGARVERPAPRIHDLFPPDAYVSTRFSVRFDGMSVLGVAGEGFSPDSTVYFGDEPLLTQFGSSDSLAATVPSTLIERVGNVPVSVRDATGSRSPAVAFAVVPPRPAGACPEIQHIYPSSTEAGRGFSLRADGSSSLGVAGRNFGPDSFVLVDGRKTPTTYQGPGSLIASIPAEALSKRGRVRIAVAEGKCRLFPSPEDLEVR